MLVYVCVCVCVCVCGGGRGRGVLFNAVMSTFPCFLGTPTASSTEVISYLYRFVIAVWVDMCYISNVCISADRAFSFVSW